MATMKIIWRVSRDVEILALENNLFLFKFQCDRDKERILEGGGWTNFLRVRVEINIKKPLRRTVKLQTWENGREVWGRLTYKRLASFCYCCGLLGYIDADCEKGNDRENINSGAHQYGD
ncbi:hypothetical protein PTKIN_Ptkin12aG0187600 [Pterospermum kingtungense]